VRRPSDGTQSERDGRRQTRTPRYLATDRAFALNCEEPVCPALQDPCLHVRTAGVNQGEVRAEIDELLMRRAELRACCP
jgi:hypothetical protein